MFLRHVVRMTLLRKVSLVIPKDVLFIEGYNPKYNGVDLAYYNFAT